VANRINGTESLTRKGFNCLLQQNRHKADSCTAAKKASLFDHLVDEREGAQFGYDAD
jgi:hypothetical protein